ncbi:hypothetical protein G6N05_09920 [Flavobacterium sp. F372]|uniref:HEAT repeat domain-containing protein n=1 Tax=Flavobacterium bernardetii TaxID=2813823 RepID=A0ABR7IYD2_9FLAO|nr:hypothetical protein [Flavobacterium bernardetii]MBC5834775.1 hypothetical protein [Flavobacterium bernardetii]NHF70423.1 hypothetical protein [Flavobacterium bernardetii]
MKRFLIIVLVICNHSFGQVSKELTKTLEPVEKYSYFFYLNESLEKIEDKVQKIAKSDELEFLALKGKTVYVKAVAIRALINRDDAKIINVFKKTLVANDSMYYEDETSSRSLVGFYFECLSYYSEVLKKERQDEIKSELTTVLLENPSGNLKYLNEISSQIPTNISYYKKIKDLVISTRSEALLFTLAKYQNREDIELIKSFKEDAFDAIRKFPDESFFYLLEEYLNSYDDLFYQFALSEYCSEKSGDLISKIIDFKLENLKNGTCDERFCLKSLYGFVSSNDCEFHLTKLEKLWLSHKILSFDVLGNYQKNHNNTETADFILSGLNVIGNAELLINENKESERDLVFSPEKKFVKLLKVLKSLSLEKYQLALSKIIFEIDDLEMHSFIVELNDKSSLINQRGNLIKKMELNETAYGLLVMMDGIKELDDKKLFEDCFEVIKKRRNEFKKFEVWEEKFQEFLKDNKLKL